MGAMLCPAAGEEGEGNKEKGSRRVGFGVLLIYFVLILFVKYQN